MGKSPVGLDNRHVLDKKTPNQASGLSEQERAWRSIEQLSEMIEGTEWASEFSWSQIQTLAKFIDCYVIEQGKLIVREGERDGQMILIVRGEVNIVKSDSSDTEKVIATLGQGKTFGEMSLIDGEPRSASAVALTDVTLLALSKENFTALITQYPVLSVTLVLKISKMMSQRLRQADGRLIEYLEEE